MASLFDSIVHHIALPPKLPGAVEKNLDEIEVALVDRLIHACRSACSLARGDLVHHFDTTRFVLQTCKTLNTGRVLKKASLLKEFSQLGTDHPLILHVTEQNAGIFVHKTGSQVIIESFEASARSEQVLAASNALVRAFPGSAVAIPDDEFNRPTFQNSLATFLEQASTESIKLFAGHSNKAGSLAFENRETVDPALITDLLMTTLQAYGKETSSQTIYKRVRDDVCWSSGGSGPWRRSPFWLIVRVCLSRHLRQLHGQYARPIYYKMILCIVLKTLIDDTAGRLHPGIMRLLNAKLARRLVKLEASITEADATVRSTLDAMFKILEPHFAKTLEACNALIGRQWENAKSFMKRQVRNLPPRADPSHLRLSLLNSWGYLQQVLMWRPPVQQRLNNLRSLAPKLDASQMTASQYHIFAARYSRLVNLETSLDEMVVSAQNMSGSVLGRCIGFADAIDNYIAETKQVYDSNQEQKSGMLLRIMSLWMLMDECAVEAFPLMGSYSPGVKAESLDVLHLMRREDFRRLQRIQTYLHRRTNGTSDMTIFSDPSPGCFPEIYYEESADASQLSEMHRKIEAHAAKAKEAKEEEWQKMSDEYRQLQQKIAACSCLYKVEDYVTVHDNEKCTRCYLNRRCWRMKIGVHEHPLPTDLVAAKAVVFELAVPDAFRRYRDTTWKIIGTLGSEELIAGAPPNVLLQTYSKLKRFHRGAMSGISLASTTKSFLSTHYSHAKLPVDFEQVCLPNGLKLAYHDPVTATWPGRLPPSPSFAHHCRIVIPPTSAFAPLRKYLSSTSSNSSGPSSYETVASQTKCPTGLNCHEFTAFQHLMSGQGRKWLVILGELGASNLNFSMDSVASVISQLAVQAGSQQAGNTHRAIHEPLNDRQFCAQLIDQIQIRLNNISAHWRERHCMDMLLTLTLHVCEMGEAQSRAQARKLLISIRATTLHWIRKLRTEIQESTEAKNTRTCSEYAMWAALLCKRTFSLVASTVGDLSPHASLIFEELQIFIECSVTLQDNLAGDPRKLSLSARNAIIRDVKMVRKVSMLLLNSVKTYPQCLAAVLNQLYAVGDGENARRFSNIEMREHPHDGWITSYIEASAERHEQQVDLHLFEGYLLINGQPVGRLPPEHRESLVLEELFGKQSLVTWPTSMPGMKYAIARQVYGHEVHIGFRDGQMIVRACFQDDTLELIPREVFGDPNNFDLPASLVMDCVHWLNTRTGRIEVRQRPDIWKLKPSNWHIDLGTRRATRRRSCLVDPRSAAFRSITGVLSAIEYPNRVTIYQHPTHNISAELRRLELMFFINAKGLLQCKQLHSEVDLNQDAGTWYGLQSCLVMRDIVNPRERSIILPLGKVSCQQQGLHVSVTIANEGRYARYILNDTLGRLEGSVEPALLYMKAYLHACTSFAIEDPLTGRTGAEEAIHCLKQGQCQPWRPLGALSLPSLQNIAKLTPTRNYYPQDMKVMQQVTWNPDLNTSIQNESFAPIVEAIFKKSRSLSLFWPGEPDLLPPNKDGASSSHLTKRALFRRQIYQRCTDDTALALADATYMSRDRLSTGERRANCWEAVNSILQGPSKLEVTSDLSGLLQNWPTIQGHNREFEPLVLSDLLNVDFAAEWGALANLCRSSSDKDRLAFNFATISYRSDAPMEVIRTLMAFFLYDDVKSLEPPQWPLYQSFRYYQTPTVDALAHMGEFFCVPYAPNGMQNSESEYLSRKQLRQRELAKQDHEERAAKECRTLSGFLLQQWPCQSPDLERAPELGLVDIEKALEAIVPEWLRLFQNHELSKYIEVLQKQLDLHYDDSSSVVCREDQLIEIDVDVFHTTLPNISLQNLMVKTYPRQAQTFAQTPTAPTKARNVRSRHDDPTIMESANELEITIREVENSASTVRQNYGRDLRRSLEALKVLRASNVNSASLIAPSELAAAVAAAQAATFQQYRSLCASLQDGDPRAKWLLKGGLWPSMGPVSLLEQLRSTSNVSFSSRMREALINYACAITTLQRCLRMQDAQFSLNGNRRKEEEQNIGHVNWKPLEHSDWILLEIDSNILIRAEQVDVANATISPASNSNSVLQLNMGKGKTSCIMPMAAAFLADKKRLVRVIVPEALLLQTAQIMQMKLGGLVGREICHAPFSRRTPTNNEIIKTYFEIHKALKASSGVIVALPEHLMSFTLSGLQRLADNRVPEATSMVNVQSWMKKHSRDILDECDFTLAVRTQLIYPSGPQTTIDGHPHRWEIAESMLTLTDSHIWGLRERFPQSLEVVRRAQGGFPLIFFLRKDVEEALLDLLVADIVEGKTSILPVQDMLEDDRLAIREFITAPVVRDAASNRVHALFSENLTAKKSIYLLRGLLVHRILLLTLKKRWNVQYGLHPDRDPIAVPYHAKGVPSEHAEWGHPDVAILFTCLAFYLGGLSVTQARQGLEHLIKSDDPASEFERWTQASVSLPHSLRQWNVINVEDDFQLHELWQHLRYSVVVIDYFLNKFVFPRHAKQFSVKMQTSGWDLPLEQLPVVPNIIQPLTTGFSGTNDNRTLLPLNIAQKDLAGLSHTNAEVLTYLLEPRNRSYVLAADWYGKRLSEYKLLKGLEKKGIRMLIDAGAQILEMDNQTVIETWLTIDTGAPAGMYFDSENRPYIRHRNGTRLPLLASLYAENLGDCLVYLDDVHTRGTDLKMPPYATGALTLGMGQTKDHTVQAAMRLRQLGTTQSVVFMAPPEVHQSILDVRRKVSGATLDSYDVICWLLEQTCSGLEQLQPLHYAQGVDYCRRSQALRINAEMLCDQSQRDQMLSVLRQKEHETLLQLYKPRTTIKVSKSDMIFDTDLEAFMKELRKRRKGFQDTGNAVHASALQEVQQEREVAYEVEAIKEVQKPVHFSPLTFHGLHDDIKAFVDTGMLSGRAGGYEPAFAALRRTTLGSKYNISPQGRESDLYISMEFMRTVKLARGKEDVNFIRPVTWILWSEMSQTALIVIPEEAELLIPAMRNRKKAYAYLMLYAAPVTRTMTHFDNLTYYTIPALPTGWQAPTWLRIELGIFAGRLYFDFEDYAPLCLFLGLKDPTVQVNENEISNEESTADADATIDGEPTVHVEAPKIKFADKPTEFLREWLAVRRKGQDFTHTPMGYLCQGKKLTADHPFFNASAAGAEVGAAEAYTPWKEEREEKVEVVSEGEDEDEEGLGVEAAGEGEGGGFVWGDEGEDKGVLGGQEVGGVGEGEGEGSEEEESESGEEEENEKSKE